MIKTLKTAAFITLGATLPSYALDFGEGLTTTGEFELEYVSATDYSETIGYGKVDIAYDPIGGGIGGFVGFDGVSTSVDSLIAVYGALSYSGDFGKIQVGVPRAALEDYIKMPSLGGTRQLELLTNFIGGSVLTTSYLLGDLSEAPVGLRYDGTVGQAAIGASAHRFVDTTFVDLAVNYTLGSTVLRGGVEHITDGVNDLSILHFGANATFSQIETGFMVTTSSEAELGSMFAVFGTYSPSEKLDMTLTATSLNNDLISTTAFGINADYNFTPSAYIQAGAISGADFDSAYNLSIGVKF